jgi:hypothetical protein
MPAVRRMETSFREPITISVFHTLMFYLVRAVNDFDFRHFKNWTSQKQLVEGGRWKDLCFLYTVSLGTLTTMSTSKLTSSVMDSKFNCSGSTVCLCNKAPCHSRHAQEHDEMAHGMSFMGEIYPHNRGTTYKTIKHSLSTTAPFALAISASQDESDNLMVWNQNCKPYVWFF